MAKIHGVIIPKASGSIGNITFRTSQRETVASEKIIKNPSKTPAQVEQRANFKDKLKFAPLFQPVAKLAYSREGFKTAYSKLTRRMLLATDASTFNALTQSSGISPMVEGDIVVNRIGYTFPAEGTTGEAARKFSLSISFKTPTNARHDENDALLREDFTQKAVVVNLPHLVPFSDLAEDVEITNTSWSEDTCTVMMMVTAYENVRKASGSEQNSYLGDDSELPMPLIVYRGKRMKLQTNTPVYFN